MSDIVKMIKLYKGVNSEQLKSPELIFSNHRPDAKSSELFSRGKKRNDSACPINVVQQFQRSIEGWEI